MAGGWIDGMGRVRGLDWEGRCPLAHAVEVECVICKGEVWVNE